MDTLEIKKIQELDNKIADIDLKISEIQKLISANDEKEKAIENQIAQEKDKEKRKSLNIELTEITRDTLCLQQKQIELNAQQLALTRKKFEELKKARNHNNIDSNK